jgi:AraC-like DNA-binding protein
VPFAPQVRKHVLQALDEYIIPALRVQNVVQILAELPYDFSGVEHHIERRKLLPHKMHGPLQMVRHWKEERMVSSSMLNFGFVYEGISYERVGVTTAQAKTVKSPSLSPAGITRVHLQSPAIICYPPCTLHSDGSLPANRWPGKTRVFCFNLTQNDLRLSISERDVQTASSTHRLQVNDPLLVQMGQIYLDELRQRDVSSGAQAQLLAFMQRLKRNLERHKPGFANSCWVDATQVNRKIDETDNPRHQELCTEIVEYIHSHLHLQLTLSLLAQRFGFSEFHLNCIFKQVLGMTVVQYVALQRIETAKFMMLNTQERINDVAQLTGFASAASFCNVFRKHTGLSPNEFRRVTQRKAP